MYARTNQQRPVYTCGRYMRTSGAECASNQIDAEAMLRFLIKTLKQSLYLHGGRDQLRKMLIARANRETQKPAADPREAELTALRARRVIVEAELAAIEYRMARESNDNLYKALSRQYQAAQAEMVSVEEDITRAEIAKAAASPHSPNAVVEGALSWLDDIARIINDPAARSDVNPLMRQLGIWIGLTFRNSVKGKKRKVQKLFSGQMVFHDDPLPVPLFGNANPGCVDVRDSA